MLSAIPDDSISQVGIAPYFAAIPGKVWSMPGLLTGRSGLECAPMNALKYSAENTTAVPSLGHGSEISGQVHLDNMEMRTEASKTFTIISAQHPWQAMRTIGQEIGGWRREHSIPEWTGIAGWS